MPATEAAEILGHEKPSFTYSVYSMGLALPARKAVVEKITYPGLDLSHLYPPDTP